MRRICPASVPCLIAAASAAYDLAIIGAGVNGGGLARAAADFRAGSNERESSLYRMRYEWAEEAEDVVGGARSSAGA